ncbi:PepSY domain-containing protein [Sphingobacterium multivorum]|uniref:PepSY domain-containing protein n=1 Tax=Sphingobacterium multivorum TaxID=28454 RepID=UPI0036989683
MNLRRYNIYFNTHTISGIIICAILYVIFFAGSFSFFKNEINAWQKTSPTKVKATKIWFLIISWILLHRLKN